MNGSSPRSTLLVVLAVIIGTVLLWILLPTGDETAEAAPSTDALSGEAAGQEQNAGPLADGNANPDLERSRVEVADDPTDDQTGSKDAFRLWGRVIRKADETPIPGAEVQLLHADSDQFWNLDLEYGRNVEQLGRVTTDQEGRFAFPVERSRLHRLKVTAYGFPGITVEGRTGGAEIIIALGKPASVEGIVLDKATSEPIVDAEIRIAVRGEHCEVAKGRSDSAGRFRFLDMPAVGVYVQVKSPDYPEEWEFLDIRAGKRNEVTVRIERGRKVEGKVIDKVTRKPIAGAEICGSWTFDHVVRSAVDGRFAIGGLNASRYSFLYVRASGYASFSRTIPVDFKGEVTVEMVRGGTVRGRVVTAEGKAPGPVYLAVGASFSEAAGYRHTDWIRVGVDPSGLFRVAGLRPDQHYWLYARGRGYGTRVYALPGLLASGEEHDLGNIVMLAAGGIEGQVVDEAGKPRSGLTVSIRGMNSDSKKWLDDKSRGIEVSQFSPRDVRSDRDGGFRFAGVSGGSYTLSTRIKGHHRSHSIKIEVVDGVLHDGIVLTVPAGRTISGKVVRPDGGKFAARAVWLKAGRKDGTTVTSVVDGDGNFRFGGLKDGEYSISIWHARELDGWTLRRVHGVRAGTTDLRLELTRAGRVTGRVTGPDGKPVRARVWFRGDDETGGMTLHATDAEGKFELDVPPGFRGTFFASRLGAGGISPSFKVEGIVAGQTGVVIRLKK